MRNVPAVVLVVLATLAWAGPAAAQSRAPSAREREYGTHVARAFGQDLRGVRTVELTEPLGGGLVHSGDVSGDVTATIDPPPVRATGVVVTLAGGSVERYRFGSAEAAERFAAYEGDAAAPSMVEVRGDQMLVIRGPIVDDPDALARAREASWGVIPAPREPTAALGVYPREGEAVITGRPGGPVDRKVQETLERARSETARHPEQYGWSGDGDVRVSLPRTEHSRGLTARVTRDGRGATCWLTRDPSRAEALQRHLDTLTGARAPAPPAVRALNGAADRLGASLFDE